MDEFGATQGEDVSQTKVVTTLTRAASNLARWHDILFFSGQGAMPPPVQMPPVANPPSAEFSSGRRAGGGGRYPVDPRGCAFKRGVGSCSLRGGIAAREPGLFQRISSPSAGRSTSAGASSANQRCSMVLPRDRIEPTLMEGGSIATTTLPPNEALLASLDGCC